MVTWRTLYEALTSLLNTEGYLDRPVFVTDGNDENGNAIVAAVLGIQTANSLDTNGVVGLPIEGDCVRGSDLILVLTEMEKADGQDDNGESIATGAADQDA